MTDPERIWLQNQQDAGEEGRLWCQDKVWPDDPEDGEPTEYVRADLYAAAQTEIERLQIALQRLVISGQKAHDIGFRKTDIWDEFGRDLDFAKSGTRINE